jgi:general secretion pathway protein C
MKNKRARIIQVAFAIAAMLNMVFLPTAEAGIRDFLNRDKELPAIELKGVELKGTAVTGICDPIAIVEDTVSKRSYWYKKGDNLRGGRIVDIKRGAVVLEMKGRRYLFGLPLGEVEGVPELASKGAGDKRGFDAGRRVGDNAWDLKLSAAIDMVSRVNEIMRDARIRPYFAIGKAAGVRIDRIRDESIIRKMGLRDGDIIKGVNGFGLHSPTKVFEAYRRYKNDSLIQLQLIRDEEPITLTYNIIK